MTYLEILNKVLLRLRESEVASVTETTYAQLIGEYLEEGLAEIQEAYQWSGSCQYITATSVAATEDVILADSNIGGNMAIGAQSTTADSYIIPKNDGSTNVWVYASGDTTGTRLDRISYEDYRNLIASDTSAAANNGTPSMYAVRRGAAGTAYAGSLILSLYPVDTTNAYTVKAYVYNPTTEITDWDDEVHVPWRVLVLYGTMRALNERGEEIGEPGHMAEQRYITALGAAIEADMTARVGVNLNEFVID